ncbi:MAG: hypothetical protein KAK00_08425 [Nanoarchaeota archaeon]|nr:hypothetical protein [Nanoarchaeota archaeon]
MKKGILILLVLGIVFLSACVEEEFLLCPDNVTRVIDLVSCPKERPRCPESCDDNDNCTVDRCSAVTDYKCVYEEAIPCDGNDVCEEGEFPWSADCPNSCDDNNGCTSDIYNYQLGKCSYEPITPCCGNDDCETGETYVNCYLDCEQLLELKVTRYEKRQRFEGAASLVGTDYTYLIIRFNIRNVGYDNEETINYRKQKGFYYDPYKMRLEDDSGKFYDVEYDSDALPNWLDYFIISKGDTKGAALLFIVPMSARGVRLVAYDKFGSRQDISDVY